MKVKFCTNCGFELSDGVNFCPICGTKRAEIKIEKKEVVTQEEKISGENDVVIENVTKTNPQKEKSTSTKKKTTKTTESKKSTESGNEDIVVKCEECGKEIIYTAEQQATDIKESGFADAPKFCKDCKIKRMKSKKTGEVPDKKSIGKVPEDLKAPKTTKSTETTKSTKSKKSSESGNKDIVVKCEQCGGEIIYTAEQQAADIKESGFADAPKFCKDCKTKRMKSKKTGEVADKKSIGKVPEDLKVPKTTKSTETTKTTKSTKTKKSSESGNKDIVVKCEDCGKEIIYTAEQQAADIKKFGFADAPKFCKDCKTKRMKSKKTGAVADKKSVSKVPETLKAPKTIGNSQKKENKSVKMAVNKSQQIINKETGFCSMIDGYYGKIVTADEKIKELRKAHGDEFAKLTSLLTILLERRENNLKAQEQHVSSINSIKSLFGEMYLKRYPTKVSNNYTYSKLYDIHKDMSNSGFFGVRESARRKATTIANEAINFHLESIEYLKNECLNTEQGLLQCKVSRESNDKKLNDGIKKVISDIKKICSSTAFSGDNSDLKKYYAELYGAEGSTTKAYGDEFFERSHVLLGKTRKRLADVDIELIKTLKKIKSEFVYVDNSDKDVVFLFPEIDHLKDSNSIYYFRQQVIDNKNNSNAFGNVQQNVAEDIPKSNIYQVRNAIQSYIYQILQHSKYEDYEFVFCDPVSNGQSFGEMISLAHDDGYGVVNSIHCERNEISKALTQISNKIKDINEKLKGYDSIYDYNRKERDPLPTTVLVAFNFCDQYYEQDKIKPILENASKCGITVFFVESNNPTNKVEECRIALSAYKHNIFDFEKYENEEFDFITAPCDLDDWTKGYNDKKKAGVTINTNYSELGDLLPKFFSREATEGLHIPFAVDKRNGIVDFHLGVNMCYHAFVSGTTGIGKSVLLHSIITNVIRCYHPDDVELWLVDYKAVEFFDYVRFAPPHIKLVGLDRSWEFTKSFIDKIVEVAEERKRIAGFKDINKYKKKYGARSMPHIVICIDEAHVLSQQIQHVPEYKEKFENILSEYRAFGIHIIMSDQAFSNSMAGITPKGKNQIGVRLAMKNSRDEVNSTIEVDNQIMSGDEFRNTANSLSVGDVIYRWYEDSKTANAILHLDKVKALFSDPEREAVCNQAKALAKKQGYNKKNPWIVVGKERTSIFDVKNPFEDDALEIGNDKRFNMFLGTPSSLDPYHMITVKRRKSANFMVVSDNDDISCSVAYFTAANMVRVADAKIFVIAPSDTVDPSLKDALTESYGDRVVFAEDMEAYNEVLDEIKSTDERVFVIWYGLDEVIDEMEMLDPPPREKNKSRSSSFDIGFSDPFGTGKSAMDELSVAFGNSGDNEDYSTFGVKEYYDRTDEIVELLERGSASFKFSMVVLQNSKEILKRRDIKLSFFEHKFVYNVSEYRNVFETSCPIKIEGDLQKSSVIYYDGAEFSILRPYKIDKDTIEYFEE